MGQRQFFDVSDFTCITKFYKKILITLSRIEAKSNLEILNLQLYATNSKVVTSSVANTSSGLNFFWHAHAIFQPRQSSIIFGKMWSFYNKQNDKRQKTSEKFK